MEHCNYGHVQGIVGINCKHFFTIWYGSLEKDKLEFTYKENEEQYKKSQQQRYLENGVRKWKRKQVIANKAQDEEGYKKASAKTKEWQDRLNTFTTENDLKRDYTREHIKAYKVSTKTNNSGKISLNKNEEVKDVQYIGKLDKKKLGKYKEKIITDEVVLTDERMKHIKEHHPGDYEKYGEYILEILNYPDYVIDDSKNLDTVLYMKTIKENEKNIQIVVRLNTNKNEKNKKNSILTLWKIKDKTYKQLIRNKEILWKKIDNNE